RGEHGPALEVRAGQVAGQRVEVIPVPRRLEQRDLVRRDPRVAEFFPPLVLGPCLDRKAHLQCVPSLPDGRADRSDILRGTPARAGTAWDRLSTPPLQVP